MQITTIGYGSGNEVDEELMQRLASVSASGKPLYEFCLDANKLTAFLKKQTQTITY